MQGFIDFAQMMLMIHISLQSTANRTETTLRLFINPNDPVIMAADTPEGDKLYIIGEKDSSGRPTDVRRFQVEDSEGNSTYSELDENGTLTSAFDSSGMRMDLVWDSNYTSVQINLVLPNNSQQLTINIDLTENITNTTLDFDGENVERRSVANPRHQLKDYFDDEGIPPEVPRTQKTKSKSKRQVSTNAARVSINVISCEGPEPNAIVQAFATVDDMTTTYNGVQSGMPGLYYIFIPTESASTIGENIGEVCSYIEMALDKACDWYGKVKKTVDRVARLFGRKKHSAEQYICFALANGLKLIPHLRLVPIYRFCKKIFLGASYYCDKINAPIVEGITEKKWSELLCEQINEHVDNAIDSFRDTEVYLKPYAIFPAGHTIFAPRKRLVLPPGSNEVSTTFTINDDSDLQITRLIVLPADPAPLENYAVTVRYECYTPSTQVSMIIVGTDNYVDSNSCTGGPTCVLHVPGAKALVRDTVTITITNPSAQSLSRQLIIIF